MDPQTTADLANGLLALTLKAAAMLLSFALAYYGPRLTKAIEATHLDAQQRAVAAMAVRAAEQMLDNNQQKYIHAAEALLRRYPALGADPPLLQSLIEGAVHELKAGVLLPLEHELSAPPVPQA